MSKIEKKLNKWLNNTPKEAPKKEVLAVIKRFFDDWSHGTGSHIAIHDDRLKGHPKCFNGDFTVVVKGGQKVPGQYLKRLAKIIEFLNIEENDK